MASSVSEFIPFGALFVVLWIKINHLIRQNPDKLCCRATPDCHGGYPDRRNEAEELEEPGRPRYICLVLNRLVHLGGRICHLFHI